MSKFDSTLLVQTFNKEETNKALLDILQKVNKVSDATNTSSSTLASKTSVDLSTNSATLLFMTSGSSAVNVNLGYASSSQPVTIVKIDSGSGPVTINTKGTDTIGSLTNVFSLYAQNDYVTLSPNDKTWWVTNTNGPELSYTNASNTAIVGPTVNVWYNPTGHSLLVPAGYWSLDYFITVEMDQTSGPNIGTGATLSTTTGGAPGNASDKELISIQYVAAGSGSYNILQSYINSHSKNKRYSSNSSTTWYLNMMGLSTGITGLTTRVDFGTTKIRARRIG